MGIVKATHIILMVTWFAGLFYLPRLFVYHAMAADKTSQDRFKIMERKLFYGIMMPGALLTIATGFWLVIGWGFESFWIQAKLSLVGVLVIYHIWCGVLVKKFKNDQNQHSHVWYRWFNEFPVFILVAIVFLVVLKP
ncbi:MAG: CopD family protein [Proteobacteria bacterium]|nr:CopD family protein [Pseudomonadota bacterium]